EAGVWFGRIAAVVLGGSLAAACAPAPPAGAAGGSPDPMVASSAPSAPEAAPSRDTGDARETRDARDTRRADSLQAVSRRQASPRTTFDSLARESLAQLDGRVRLAGLTDSVEVVRDRWGVPHIYARNLDDLFFAQGFVHAQDRLWQMEMYRRTYEGTLAEIMGPDYVRHDRLMRLLRLRGPFTEEEWQSYHPE